MHREHGWPLVPVDSAVESERDPELSSARRSRMNVPPRKEGFSLASALIAFGAGIALTVFGYWAGRALQSCVGSGAFSRSSCLTPLPLAVALFITALGGLLMAAVAGGVILHHQKFGRFARALRDRLVSGKGADRVRIKNPLPAWTMGLVGLTAILGVLALVLWISEPSGISITVLAPSFWMIGFQIAGVAGSLPAAILGVSMLAIAGGIARSVWWATPVGIIVVGFLLFDDFYFVGIGALVTLGGALLFLLFACLMLEDARSSWGLHEESNPRGVEETDQSSRVGPVRS